MEVRRGDAIVVVGVVVEFLGDGVEGNSGAIGKGDSQQKVNKSIKGNPTLSISEKDVLSVETEVVSHGGSDKGRL